MSASRTAGRQGNRARGSATESRANGPGRPFLGPRPGGATLSAMPSPFSFADIPVVPGIEASAASEAAIQRRRAPAPDQPPVIQRLRLWPGAGSRPAGRVVIQRNITVEGETKSPREWAEELAPEGREDEFEQFLREELYDMTFHAIGREKLARMILAELDGTREEATGEAEPTATTSNWASMAARPAPLPVPEKTTTKKVVSTPVPAYDGPRNLDTANDARDSLLEAAPEHLVLLGGARYTTAGTPWFKIGWGPRSHSLHIHVFKDNERKINNKEHKIRSRDGTQLSYVPKIPSPLYRRIKRLNPFLT